MHWGSGMRSESIGKWAPRGAMVALLSVVLCACGGGKDDEPGAATHPPSTGSAPPAPTPVPPQQSSPGAATVEWVAPQTATDGSPLTNLAGYRIYYGTDVTQMTQRIEVANPGVLTYMIEGLSPATYYFAVTAVNARGQESERSNAGRKIIT